MFKRVAKATSKKVLVDDLKDAAGDDTAIGIDKLVDESSSSEGEDSDGDDDDDDSEDDQDVEKDGEAEDEDSPKAGSKRKRSKDEQQDEQADDVAAQVTIDDAIKDPIYVPTEGEKKHGIFASRCIVCEAAVLKSTDLVNAHLEAKAHKRRLERFHQFVQNQLSETQRKALDARDAVEQMDAWKAQQDELEKQKLAAAPPSKRALAKKRRQPSSARKRRSST
ncbi:hypothetical protein EX895_005635 [Sporisorium graminicola]|uniref:Uncharacterized protein n=1 Tax=Sporisorium graminicola TaxID=280036 RepID=A0A4U7KMZ5_9BASI|nr:hypothetical protein EX895_005635 [Sporisorium graminicola]TKY85473.1 hypothetical protein EX895_005635 [Sporisorium graminicola]